MNGKKAVKLLLPLLPLILALVIRLITLIQIRDAPFFDVLIIDAEGYDRWAREIAGGDWLGHGVFYQAPLYPYFMGLVYRLFGADPSWVRLIQIVLGSLAALLLAKTAARIFDWKTGVLAGVLLAVNPAAVFFDLQIQKTGLALFLLVVWLWLLWCRPRPLFGLGVVLGLLILTRENALVLIPVLLAAALAEKKRMRAAAAALLGLGLILMAVGLRNLCIGGEFHLTTSQAGPNFYIGNRTGANGTYQPLRPGRSHPDYEAEDAKELAEEALGRCLSPAEVSRYWTDRAMGDIRRDPAAWLRLTAKKLLLTLNRIEMADAENIETYRACSPLLDTIARFYHFGVLAPFAALGMALTWRNRKPLWPLYVIMTAVTLSVVLFYVFARYRALLLPLLVPFAAAALTGIVTRPVSLRRSAVPLAAALAAALLCNWPVVSEAHIRSFSRSMWWNVANVYALREDSENALDCYLRALEYDPDNPELNINAGHLLYKSGRVLEAQSRFTRAIRARPYHTGARLQLAGLLARNGDLRGAAAQYRKILEIDSTSSMAYKGLGDCAVMVREMDRAERFYLKALEFDSLNTDAIHNLSLIYARSGRREKAAELRKRTAAGDSAMHTPLPAEK